MAKNMMSFYKGNEPGQTPGLLPKPYYCEPVIREEPTRGRGLDG